MALKKDKMLKVTWHSNSDIRIEELQIPQPNDGEMLVEVISCGLCGSDLLEWYRLPRAPFTPGHEVTGEIVEVGKKVTNFSQGQKVVIVPKIPCRECHYCQKGAFSSCSAISERLPGAFAKYIVIPESIVIRGVYPLPDNMTSDQGTFTEPLACAIQAQKRAKVATGQSIMVFGCGTAGLLHIKLAKFNNCAITAVDINPDRLNFAEKIGADVTLNPNTHKVPKMVERQADVVIICTSALPAIEDAWKCVDKGGYVVFFAVPEIDSLTIPIQTLWLNNIDLVFSYYCGPLEISEALVLLNTGKIEVDDLISHRLPLSDIDKAYQLAIDAKDSFKVIIEP
ncbi:MAG: alcohol dehydrogenase catalytic domain-containing protein [Patescibacteria group bacterium]